MTQNQGMSRRRMIGLSASALAAVSAADLLASPSAATGAGAGTTEGIGYFARFGVTEQLIRETLSAALSKGGEYADVFFQHKVASNLGLEDGAVNRAYASVELGVGVRVVKGDQTGYGYTEELTPAALKRTALTAAAIADGPAKQGPKGFKVESLSATRYPVKTRWEDVRPEQKLPFLTGLNERVFAADKRVKKVNVSFMDQGGAVLVLSLIHI